MITIKHPDKSVLVAVPAFYDDNKCYGCQKCVIYDRDHKRVRAWKRGLEKLCKDLGNKLHAKNSNLTVTFTRAVFDDKYYSVDELITTWDEGEENGSN